jgi:hypothetical protein
MYRVVVLFFFLFRHLHTMKIGPPQKKIVQLQWKRNVKTRDLSRTGSEGVRWVRPHWAPKNRGPLATGR